MEPPKKEIPPKTYKNWSYALGILIAVIIIIYWPILNHSFLKFWDDNLLVTSNPYVLSPPTLKDLLNPFNPENYTAGYGAHIPLTTGLSILINKWFGMNTKAFHATSLLLYLGCVILVYFFYRRIGNPRMALITTALFAFCVAHVENVAWIADLKDLVAAFCLLISLLFYLTYVQREKESRAWLWFLGSVIAFIFALHGKPTVLGFPLLLLFIDGYQKRLVQPLSKSQTPASFFARIRLKPLLEKIIFIPIVIFFIIITIRAQEFIGAKQEGVGFVYSQIQYITLSLYALGNYFPITFLPFGKSALYEYPIINSTFYGKLTLMIAISTALFFFLRKKVKSKSLFILGIGIFLSMIGTVLPILGGFGTAVAAERYLLIPSIGLFLIVGSQIDYYWDTSTIVVRWVLRTATVIYLLLCIIGITQRLPVWKSDRTIWSAESSEHKLAHAKLGTLDLVDSDISTVGITAENQALVTSGFEHLQKSVQLGLRSTEVYMNIAVVFEHLQLWDSMIIYYNYALELKPYDADASFQKGRAYQHKQQFDSAMYYFKKSLRFNYSNSSDVFLEIGNIFWYRNKFDSAIINYTQSILLNPRNAVAYRNRGTTKQMLNQLDEALRDLDTSIKLDSTIAENYNQKARVYQKKNQFDLAQQNMELSEKFKKK